MRLKKRETPHIVWCARGRSNTATRESFKRISEAGCWAIEYGFESGNQELLDNIKKGITLEDSRNVAAWAHEFHIDIFGTFMLALPGETPEKGEQTIRFAKELDCTYAAFIPTHPFVGTELYDDALKQGKFVNAPYTDKMSGTRFVPTAAYVPDGYRDAQQIDQLVKKAYRDFYIRPSYILKHLKKMRTMDDIRRYWYGFKAFMGLM